ncbi:DNA-binding protein rif1 [Mortierella antarctica]|nr:DNA-binding protein rif1 [Mortierella antarctica]
MTGEPKGPAPAASPGSQGTRKSPQRARREQDMSYLQRPTIPKHHHPPQPPLNANFERPKTRAHRSSETGSDPVQPTVARDTIEAIAPDAPEPTESTQPTIPLAPDTESTSNQSTTAASGQEEPILNPKVTQNSAVETTLQPTQQSTDTPTLDTSAVTPTTPAPTQATSPVEAVIAETPVAHTAMRAPGQVQDTSIPAQIAIVSASPSKRVAFSPNKQASTHSTPNRQISTAGRLKGILKLSSQQGELEGGQTLRRGDSGAPSTRHGTGWSGEGGTMVAEAISSLQTDDIQIRETTYTSLLAKLRSSDLTPHLDNLRESMRIFAACLLRDLEPSNPPSLVLVALKFQGYCFFNQTIVAMFTAKEVESLLTRTLYLINTTTEKPVCNLAIWSLASSKLPPRYVAPFLSQMIQEFSTNLDSRFKSLSIMNESFVGLAAIFTHYPSEIVPNIQTWLIPVISRLIYHVPGIRTKALKLITLCIPKLIEKEDVRRQQVSLLFMKDHCADFFADLTQNHVKKDDEIYAITVWGDLVTILGRVLQKHPLLNKMLKMAEYCFNSSSANRVEIKMSTFQSWTRLIYNFAIGGHIASEKPLKLMLTPIQSCFSTEKNRRVRLACTNAWIALIYALGSKLPKNAEQVLFPQLKLAIVDDSQHVRDIVLRLLTALFSNIGGEELELVEGREHIVPGTISFTDPGWYDPTWVRTELLDNGLDALFTTITQQHKIANTNQEQWRLSGLSGLPLLTQPCARVWEAIVRAVRDINQSEKGMKATEEAERAVGSLLLFIERVSQCNPKHLIPVDWPDSLQKEANLLKRDPEMAGYILRADIVHYLYVYLIETFSVRSLVTTRYRTLDKIHADVFDAVDQPATDTQLSQASEGEATQLEQSRNVMVSPIEFILKCWLAVGESIIGSAFETSFWQAVATLVDMSKSGLYVLRALYKCLDHLEDIRLKRLTSNVSVWPPESHPPSAPLIFREFECKYWSIIAQRLGTTINEMNDISEDSTREEQRNYSDIFSLLVYPFSILQDPSRGRRSTIAELGTQWPLEKPDVKTTQFIKKFKSIYLPTWSDLLRHFYRVAQHKRGNANVAMNSLALQIRMCYESDVPFIWIQTLSVSCASMIIDTMVVLEPIGLPHQRQTPGSPIGNAAVASRNAAARPGGDHSDYESLLRLCSFHFDLAYRCIEVSEDLDNPEQIPVVHVATFLMMEKLINKCPPSLLATWIQHLCAAILLWMSDPLNKISSKDALSKSYQAQLESFWNGCVIPKVLAWSAEHTRGARSAFGTVQPLPVTAIRGIYQQEHADNVGRSPSPTSSTAHPQPSRDKEHQNDKSRETVKELLREGIRSTRKSIARISSEAWIQIYSAENDETPEDILRHMQPISADMEGNSQSQASAAASQSQEMLSIPAELNLRRGITRKQEHIAVASVEQSPSKKSKQMPQHEAQSPRIEMTATPTDPPARTSDVSKAGASNYNVANNYAAQSPSTPPARRKHHTPSIDSDSSVQSSSSNKSKKRRKNKMVHSLAMDPVKKSLVAQTIESSTSNTPEGSSDDIEVSTPSKRAKKAARRRDRQQQSHQEPLPAPPVWRLNTPLKPYDPALDNSVPSQRAADDIGYESVSSGSASNASSRLVSPTRSPFIDYSSQTVTRKTTPHTEAEAIDAVAQDVEMQEVQASQMRKSSSVTTLPSDMSMEPEVTTLSNMEYSTAPDAPNPSNQQLPSGENSESPVLGTPIIATRTIETGGDFANAVGQLVEARGLVSKLDMRQLAELQNQLVTLQQAVCGVWSQHVNRDA